MYKIHFYYIKGRTKLQVFFTTFAKNSEVALLHNRNVKNKKNRFVRIVLGKQFS